MQQCRLGAKLRLNSFTCNLCYRQRELLKKIAFPSQFLGQLNSRAILTRTPFALLDVSMYVTMICRVRNICLFILYFLVSVLFYFMYKNVILIRYLEQYLLVLFIIALKYWAHDFMLIKYSGLINILARFWQVVCPMVT